MILNASCPIRARYEDSNIQAYELDTDEIANLKEKYAHGFVKQYVPDHEDELDEHNAKIQCYEGDVTAAVENMEQEYADLQAEVDGDAENDPEAEEFESELDEIDWGQDQFPTLTVPDERDVIRTTISRLQERLAKLENNGHNDAPDNKEA